MGQEHEIILEPILTLGIKFFLSRKLAEIFENVYNFADKIF